MLTCWFWSWHRLHMVPIHGGTPVIIGIFHYKPSSGASECLRMFGDFFPFLVVCRCMWSQRGISQLPTAKETMRQRPQSARAQGPHYAGDRSKAWIENDTSRVYIWYN
jgi:hypothetical protein